MAVKSRCRCCRAPISLTRHSGYCAACYRRHCRRCRARRPDGGTWELCPDCARAKREARCRTPNRRCSACRGRLPIGRRSQYCDPCYRARRAAYRAEYVSRADRACTVCRVPLTPGWTGSRCSPCGREQRVEQSRRRGKRCSLCRAAAPATGQTHCGPCNALLCAERRAKLKGDPAAALLGKPKPCPKSAAPSP